MPHYQHLQFTVDENQIAFVTLVRPEKHNAINMQLFKEIAQVAKRIKKDRLIRAVIIDGKGEDFSSGIDIKSLFGDSKAAAKLLFKWFPWRANGAQQVSTLWKELPVPVIFAIHGKCWGAGLQIALGGDFRIAAPNASISIMEGRWGLIPDMGGTLALKELMRLDEAKELAMAAKILTAEQAHEVGLISKVCEDPKAKAIKLANELIIHSPDAVAGVKKLYNKSWWSSAGITLARESLYQLKIILSPNYKIKGYNHVNDKKNAKPFKRRMRW